MTRHKERKRKMAPAREAVADRLHSAAIRLLRRLRAEDRASGVGPAQLSALSVLVFGGHMSLCGLAAAEQVRPPTMSRIVAGMRRAGLVRGQTAREDRRRLQLEATPRGARILQRGRRRRVRRLVRALRSLPAGELRRLGKTAELLLQLARKV